MKWSAGGIILPYAPIMIGAGVCKTVATTKDWLQVAPVVSGSWTLRQRNGNEGKLFHPDTFEKFLENGFGLNSFGMPNTGLEAGTSALAQEETTNPIIVSFAGFSIDDYLAGSNTIGRLKGIKARELNAGCPNTGHKILSFDPAALTRLLQRINKSLEKTSPIWLKLSPYSDPGLLKEVAETINAFEGIVDAVVTCNTFPNAFAGKDAITPNYSLGGLSGPALKPIALGQVVQFRKYLRNDIDVIGVGGITTGNDIVDFLQAGATAVQLTSLPFWLGEPKKFWEALLDPITGGRLIALLDQSH